jgi:hypothetical protein
MKDITDKETGQTCMDYIKNCDCPLLQTYYETLAYMYKDILPEGRLPLPTTCAYKMIESDEKIEYYQYFVVEGLALELSSDVFNNTEFEYVGNTFFGRLAWHHTTASLTVCKKTKWVTTNMEGLVGLQAWGSSGGYAYLKASGAERDRQVVATLERHRDRHGQYPRRLPGVNNIESYFGVTRRGTRFGRPRVPPPEQGQQRQQQRQRQRQRQQQQQQQQKKQSQTRQKRRREQKRQQQKQSKQRRGDNSRGGGSGSGGGELPTRSSARLRYSPTTDYFPE